MNIYKLEINKEYKITFPCYDDYNEGLIPETNHIIVKKRIKNGYIFEFIGEIINSKYNKFDSFILDYNYSKLKDCVVEEI